MMFFLTQYLGSLASLPGTVLEQLHRKSQGLIYTGQVYLGTSILNIYNFFFVLSFLVMVAAMCGRILF